MKKPNMAFEVRYGHKVWVPGNNWTSQDGWDSGSYSTSEEDGRVIVIAENEEEAKKRIVLNKEQFFISVREVTII